MKNICLVVTSSVSFDVVLKFLNSLKSQRRDLLIDVFFVNQNHKTFQSPFENENFSLHIIEVNKLIPLSKARNIALSKVEIDNYDMIAFPDDDCWYDSDLLGNVVDYFIEDKMCDILCVNVLDPSNNKTYGGRPRSIDVVVKKSDIFRYPISVGIFLRLDRISFNDIYFDETLGAGTKIGSGEETELVYRLMKNNLRCKYYGDIMVYHPVVDSNYKASDINKYYKYGIGFGHLCRRMVNNSDFYILYYFLYMLLRTFGGFLVSFNKDIVRKVYFSRMKGMISGFFGKGEI